MPARLDLIDRQILKELQDDGRITNVELARRVGISAPPCLRRVRALEQAGYIKNYRALLDEKRLGFEVTVFAMVHLRSQAEADLNSFEDFVRAQPLVRECWMLSGEIDFILKCVAPDHKTFQAFVADLTAAPARPQRQDRAYAAQFQGRRDGTAVACLKGVYARLRASATRPSSPHRPWRRPASPPRRWRLWSYR
jgi:DNA-binding Lrp family transcriptional regulator